MPVTDATSTITAIEVCCGHEKAGHLPGFFVLLRIRGLRCGTPQADPTETPPEGGVF